MICKAHGWFGGRGLLPQDWKAGIWCWMLPLGCLAPLWFAVASLGGCRCGCAVAPWGLHGDVVQGMGMGGLPSAPAIHTKPFQSSAVLASSLLHAGDTGSPLMPTFNNSKRGSGIPAKVGWEV